MSLDKFVQDFILKDKCVEGYGNYYIVEGNSGTRVLMVCEPISFDINGVAIKLPFDGGHILFVNREGIQSNKIKDRRILRRAMETLKNEDRIFYGYSDELFPLTDNLTELNVLDVKGNDLLLRTPASTILVTTAAAGIVSYNSYLNATGKRMACKVSEVTTVEEALASLVPKEVNENSYFCGGYWFVPADNEVTDDFVPSQELLQTIAHKPSPLEYIYSIESASQTNLEFFESGMEMNKAHNAYYTALNKWSEICREFKKTYSWYDPNKSYESCLLQSGGFPARCYTNGVDYYVTGTLRIPKNPFRANEGFTQQVELKGWHKRIEAMREPIFI